MKIHFIQKSLFYLTLFLFILVSVQATVVKYPALTGNLYKSTRYQVSVKQADSASAAYVYNSINTYTETTGNNRPLMTDDNNYCTFSFDSEVVVTVTLPLRTTAITSVEVLPKIKGILATWSANTITIPISKTGNYYVRINGEEKNPLFIFANPLEVNAPAASGDSAIEYLTPTTFTPNFTSTKSIWYFTPGLYDAGTSIATLQNIPSGTTVYLAGGVFLKGRLTAAANSTNLTVKGRGIISGENLPVVGGSYGGAIIGGGTGNQTALNLEGVIVTDAPQILCSTYKAGSVADNIKLFSWKINSDGISFEPRSTVMNCFLKVNDDNLKPMKSDQIYKDNVLWVQIFGSALQFSWNIILPAKNILVDGLDIIGFDRANLTGVANNASIVSFQNMNGATFSGNTVQNVRSDVKVYKIFNMQLKGSSAPFNQGIGTIDTLLFKNFYFPMGAQYPSTFNGNGTLSGEIKNLTFYNVNVGGTLLTTANAPSFISQTGLTSNFLYPTLPNFTTTITYDSNGTVTGYPNGSVISNPEGKMDLKFTLVPKTGYKVSTVLYNGVDVTTQLVGAVYTAPLLMANSTLNVSFVATTALSDLVNESIHCFANNNRIQINGLSMGEEVKVYGFSGNLVYTTKSRNNALSIPISKGFYIVRVDQKSFQVVVQ